MVFPHFEFELMLTDLSTLLASKHLFTNLEDCIDGELALAPVQFDRRGVQLLRRVVDTNGGESGVKISKFSTKNTVKIK